MNPFISTSTTRFNQISDSRGRPRRILSVLMVLTLLLPIAAPVPVVSQIDGSRPSRDDDGLRLSPEPNLAASIKSLFADLVKRIEPFSAGMAGPARPLSAHIDTAALAGSVEDISIPISVDREVVEGEVVSLAAIPVDRSGSPVNGLAAKWRSSDPDVVKIVEGAQALALKSGDARLVVSAGNIEREVVLSVTGKATARSAPLPPDEPVMTEQEAMNLTTPENNLGSPPGQYELASEVPAAAGRTRERHGSSNYSFDLYAASLPGRGIDASVNITYNSRVWNRSQQGGFLTFRFHADENWLAPGFRVGFGSIQGYQTLTGYGYLLIAPDGTRTQLIEKDPAGGCRRHESTDGTFVEATTCGDYDASTVLLRFTNGARVTYGALKPDGKRYPITMQDRNGNFISISYLEGPTEGRIFSIRDTLNRYINFHYDNSPEKRLVAITVPGFDDSPTPRQTIRFYYETMSLNTAGRFDVTAEVIAPAATDVLKYVYFPGTKTGFRYEYSPYFGMIYRISQMRGMQVSTTSLAETGSVTGEGTIAASTHYNYPAAAFELGPPLTDVPKYSWRRDDWLGRTTELPQTWFSSIDSVTPADCQTGEGNCTGTRTTTVTSPDGTRNISVSLIRPTSDWQNGLLVEAMVVDGPAGNETVWSKSKFYWQQGSDHPGGRDDPRIERIELTNDANQTRATSFGYDTYNNRTVVREHDLAPPGVLGPELQRSELSYETGAAWIDNRLVRLPVEIKSIVGGEVVSKIVYKYDDYSEDPLIETPGVMQHLEAYNPYATGTHPCSCHWECSNAVFNGGEQRCSDGSPPIWVCDDECPNYDPATAYRGNVTRVIAFPDTSAPEASSQNVVTSFKYDMTGNVRETGASCCRQNTFTFAEATGYAYRVQQASGDLGQLVTSTTYDRNTGLVRTTTDENDQTTLVSYDPESLRVARVDAPNGAWYEEEYNDLVFPYHVKSSSSLDADRSLSGWTYLNGKGQPFRSRSQTSDGYISRDVEYDVAGRAVRSFNLYAVASLLQDRPAGIKFTETTQRDGLGRPLSISLPDGTTVSATYSGFVDTAKDQAGKSRRRITDPLGRVIRVDEPNPNGDLGPVTAPFQPTYYQYDGNSNVIRVAQIDGNIVQERKFRYDGLSRLTHERQVEAVATLNDNGDKIGTGGLWTGVFKYDNENRLTFGTDARGVKTAIEYDGLNRVRTVSYTGEVGYQTPTATYTYDEAAAGFFNKGRLTRMRTAADPVYGIPETGQTYKYDNVGQIRKHSLSVGNKTYDLEYDYNLAGRLVSEKYPSGRVLASSVDALGITQTVSDTQRTYLNAVNINNIGQLSELLLGNGTKETFQWNDRLQVVSQALVKDSQVIQKYAYTFGMIADLANGQSDLTRNNGQVSKVESWIGSSKQWSQRFAYDHLGRLKEAREYSGGDSAQLTYKQVFDFDRYGNLYRKSASNPTTGQSDPLPTVWIEDADIDRATNRLTSGGTYDERGNLIVDSKFRSMSFSYDANSRIVGAVQPDQPEARTVYDATGNRVAEKIDDVWRYMIYDVFGHLIAEYGYASADRGGVKYLHQDQQGSVRVITNANGFVVGRTDHQAFGAEIGAGVGLRSAEQGYGDDPALRHGYGRTEKDGPSGLNHAWYRKLENQAGRWTSPDPYFGSMSLSDPQSFNRYSYVTNDPLNYIDPAGLYEACVHEAMTKYLGRLANLAPAVADKLAGYAGDDEGGADSWEYSATNPANIAKCLLGTGPSVMYHFPSAAQLRTNIANYKKYLALGFQGFEAYYQLSGFILHSIQDALGAHRGYSNRGCKGHARHGSAPDRLIGDDKFIAAANKVLQVMSGDPNAQLTSEQVKELIKKVLEACKGVDIKVAPQPGGGGGGGGGSSPGNPRFPWYYGPMWSFLDDLDSLDVGGGTINY